VVGSIENIIVDTKFQALQRRFMDKYYQEFKGSQENKFTYTPNFHEYLSLIEKDTEEQLLERIPEFNMVAFTTMSRTRKMK
jgi:ADP-ribosylation factor 2-binding protein